MGGTFDLIEEVVFHMIIVTCDTGLNSAMNDEYNHSNMTISEIEEEFGYIDNHFCSKYWWDKKDSPKNRRYTYLHVEQ